MRMQIFLTISKAQGRNHFLGCLLSRLPCPVSSEGCFPCLLSLPNFGLQTSLWKNLIWVLGSSCLILHIYRWHCLAIDYHIPEPESLCFLYI
ncbi:hypothetical protein BDW71DRAFT_178739 [Aspergillus fruticulosus]